MLWAAIRATQKVWPNAKIVVYTGDHEASKEQILGRVKVRAKAWSSMKWFCDVHHD